MKAAPGLSQHSREGIGLCSAGLLQLPLTPWDIPPKAKQKTCTEIYYNE